MFAQQRIHGVQVLRATEERRRGREVAADRYRRRRRLVRAAAVHGVDRQREAIAATRDRGDRSRPEQLAQRHHVHQQVVFLDHELGPHQIHQLVLGHHPLAPLDERKQHIERSRADLGGRAVDQHPPLHRVDFDGAAAVAAAGSGRSGVVHGCQIRPAGASREVPGGTINNN